MYFDEEEAIKLRHLRSYEWKEFMVIWRERRLELYEDYVSQIISTLQYMSYSFRTDDTWQRSIVRTQTLGMCDSVAEAKYPSIAVLLRRLILLPHVHNDSCFKR